MFLVVQYMFDSLCFLSGEFIHLSSVTNGFFPKITMAHYEGPVIHNVPATFIINGTVKGELLSAFV